MTTALETSEGLELSTDLFIDGERRPAPGAQSFAVEDPSSGETIARVADATAEDGLAALAAADRAKANWAATAPRMRSEILRSAYELMVAEAEDLAVLVTREMGKPVAESRGEVAYAADFLRWFAEEAVRIHGEYRPSPAGDARILTSRVPVGPSLLITPWNFPLAMVTRKVGAALAAGCTVVLKPAEATPLSALALAELFTRAGVPSGVMNVVPTNSPAQLTEALLPDPRLRKLSFTGSTPVGRILLAGAAQNVLRTSMELGGNAPFLVLEDADVDAAVEGAMVAKLRNVGQSCVAANRFLVHQRVAEEFTTKLADRFRQLVIGPGLDPSSQVGPLINAKQRDRALALVEDAVAAGAQLLAGGDAPAREGYFLSPTVLADVPDSARINREEIFGPVAAIRAFDDEASLVGAANDTPFGLVAFAYTESARTAMRMVDVLEAGMVGINRGIVSNAAAPFGGMNQSGVGREGGREGIDEYLEVKYATLDL